MIAGSSNGVITGGRSRDSKLFLSARRLAKKNDSAGRVFRSDEFNLNRPHLL